MELWLINKDKEINLSNIVTDVSSTGNYANVCRTCDFGIPLVQADKRTHIVDISIGDMVQLTHNNINLFTGIVWTTPRQTAGKSIDVHCKGYGIYLKKNSGFYKFNCTPEQAVRQIAKDFNIELGQIAETGVVVKRNFFGNSLYDIIMTMYSLANDKKYMAIYDKNKLLIIEKGVLISKPIKNGLNLRTLAYNDTLDNMTNRVYVYNKDNKLIDKISNDSDINKYGILSKYLKSEDNNYKNQANKLLNGIDQILQVQCDGDTSYAVGKAVMVEEPYTKVNGKFYIDEDTHIIKNGIYTNKLILNFKNIMDEKEVGLYEQAYQSENTDIVFKKWLNDDFKNGGTKNNGNNKTGSMYQEPSRQAI